MLRPNTILQSRYHITRQLGQGGMGTVYEAIDERLDITVALKESHFADEKLRKQFEREARLLARLRHPAMTRVIDHFTEGEGQFLVMDFIAGEDLWKMLQRNCSAFPVNKVLGWADQLLDALNYLHKQDPPVIHRDIKPQNLKLSDTGQIILLDFGLAKGFAGQLSSFTTSGSIFGYTPNYAPLEQIHGTGTDQRSDLYSLAATLYHLVTGKVPPDALSRATAIMSEHPDPLRSANEINGAVPAPIAEVLQCAMATNPIKRPANAIKMREMLRNASQSPATSNENLKEISLLSTVVDSAPEIQAKTVQSTESQWQGEMAVSLTSKDTESTHVTTEPENLNFRYTLTLQRPTDNQLELFKTKVQEIEGFVSIQIKLSPSGARFIEVIFSKEIDPIHIDNIAAELGIFIVLKTQLSSRKRESSLTKNEVESKRVSISQNPAFHYAIGLNRPTQDELKKFKIKLQEIEGFSSIHSGRRSPSGWHDISLIFSKQINPVMVDDIAEVLGLSIMFKTSLRTQPFNDFNPV